MDRTRGTGLVSLFEPLGPNQRRNGEPDRREDAKAGFYLRLEHEDETLMGYARVSATSIWLAIFSRSTMPTGRDPASTTTIASILS
jgi:hypothetical protein